MTTKILAHREGRTRSLQMPNLLESVWHRLDKSLTLYPIELGGPVLSDRLKHHNRISREFTPTLSQIIIQG